MKKLDWYILRQLLATFFFLCLIMAIISCVIDYTEKVDAFVKHKVSVGEIAYYFVNFIPHIITLLFPLFVFVATIYFTSRFAYRSEIIAILASGVSFMRFLRPYVYGGLILCGTSAILNHFIIPRGNKDRLAFENKYINGIPTTSDRNVHLRISKDEYVYVESYDYESNFGYKFTLETIEGTLLKERIMAERASYDTSRHIWKLYSVAIRKNDGLKESLTFHDQLEKNIPMLTPNDLNNDNAVSVTMTTPQLNQFIEVEKLRGRESLNFLLIEKYRRTAQPFAGFLMVIIGGCMASRKIRGGSGFHLAIGVAISALYMMMLQFSNTFSTKGGLDPLIATWIPNVIFIFVTLYFIRKETK